ncbi:uncharacterized protein LOC116296514 [Actinia tenebrosa]|uniref:non-specific serine/threonine protein kinase n=1 Tax=Actinia tenebrosa TaxID=6105 RepID=A0A6P8HVG7_ACTTE|nr:uncharacterized protein LOC116296514 [Actinia tenebrosa]XP_031560400.1 uncharacterized protein LOC116296514 [Actinia tenebrosa]
MRNEKLQGVCVLPPKPCHDVIHREREIKSILQEMEKLRNAKQHEITLIYLSGNPGCGKSELARQIGQKVFHDVPDKETEVKFVFTLNASSIDTLIGSYLKLAESLKCDETSTASFSQEDVVISHLQSLVAPKLRKYSSWLLIVDNVTDLKSVFRYLPKAKEKTDGNGQILVIVTRDSRFIHDASRSYTYHLSLSRGMDPDEAIRALPNISGIASDDEMTLQVVKALDLQPLAIACAATYMKRVRMTTPAFSWQGYLSKLQDKQEVTAERGYSQTLMAVVQLAIEKEMSEDAVMWHAFNFLSAVTTSERTPLEDVVQYVKICLPKENKDIVAAILSCSLILSFDGRPKEIGVHQVVQRCLLKMLTQNRMPAPLEIRCRGPEAEKVYRQALKSGEVEVYRGRIMLVGQDRAGKTSLKKSLLGLSFDPKEQSTNGVVVDPSSFSVDVDDATVDWQISKNGDANKNYEDGVARVMVQLLNQSPKIQEPDSSQSQSRPQQESNVDVDQSLDKADNLQDANIASNPVVDSSRDDVSEESKKESKGDDLETGNATRKDVVPETVIENLIQRLSAKNLGSSAGQETTVSIWDFAGQQLYYASHPVFFSHRAVYVLVYNLKKDLVAVAEPRVRQGVHEIRLDNHDQQTNLEALHSWLVSIHTARPEASDVGREIRQKLPYLRPPVFITGTHADCPFEEPKKMEEIIQKSLTGKSYENHVLRPFITVNNWNSSNDEGVKKLKENVKKLFCMEPYMGEKIPVRWFKFEQVIKSLVEEEGKNHMSLKDLERLILKVCDIEDKKEISALLNFYHDLGVILKHGNTVVLKAEWLIDLFRKLITIRPFNEQHPVNSGYWRTLEETGILDMELVEHVFKEKLEHGETKDDILAMMEHYGLIAIFRGNEDPKSLHYFVPAQLKSSPEAFFDVGPSKSDPCTLYLHCLDGFIPHGLYNCLVSRLITWCSEKGYPHKPKLYQSVSRFFIGRTYAYELFLIRRKRFVKVVLRSLQPERSWVFQPIPFQIWKFLERSLKEITKECHWYQFLNYEICVLCPSRHVVKCERHQLESCIDDDCLHLLPLKEDRELVCREGIGEESKPYVLGLEEWYREHLIVPMHNEEGCAIGGISVNPTFDLSDNQKRWLVIGICLNKILLPNLRSFIEPQVLCLYSQLKSTHNIHEQVYHGHLRKDGKCNSLNYGSINSNEANHRKEARLYDYRVTSAVDLAKLYLQPFMANFSGFDGTCDLSASLGILSSASAFSPDVQDLSNQVRKDVRNEWGHCNFSVWDKTKFTTCFKLIDSLVKALRLTPEEEKRIADELQEWKYKGVQLCMGNITDQVKFIKLSDTVLERLTCEVRHLENCEEDEARRGNALNSIRSDFEKYKDNINKIIESLEQRLECHDRKIKALELAVRPNYYSCIMF